MMNKRYICIYYLKKVIGKSKLTKQYLYISCLLFA